MLLGREVSSPSTAPRRDPTPAVGVKGCARTCCRAQPHSQPPELKPTCPRRAGTTCPWAVAPLTEGPAGCTAPRGARREARGAAPAAHSQGGTSVLMW